MATQKELRALITLAGKVDPSLQSAMLKATGQTKKLSEQYKNSAKHANTLSDIIKGSFVGSLAANGVTYLISKIKELGTEGLGLASDLKEVQNVVDTTFRDNAAAINNFAQKALDSFGLSEVQAKQFSGTLGAMFKSSGIDSSDLVRLSTDLTGLSGDLASFFNLNIEESFTKIRSGISGETEPLKQLGINMSVANMEAFALSKGITTQYQKMSQAEQMLLRYNYLMEVTADQQGDFARTSGEYANQQRLFDQNLKQASATIASEFLPYANEMLVKGNELLKNTDFAAVAKSFGDALKFVGSGIKFVVDNADIILPLLGGLLGYFGALKILNIGASFASLANPISIAALVIGGLVAVGVALYKNWDDIKASAAAFGKFMSDWGKSIREAASYAFEGIKERAMKNLEPIMNFFKTISEFLSGKKSLNVASSVNMNLPRFAGGGIATGPSLFGEAGPETAIPLKRTPRSYDLLYKTANILGFKENGNNSSRVIDRVEIHIHESSNPNITKQKIKEVFIELFGDPDDEGRLVLG